MNPVFEQMKADIARKMNPREFNQFVVHYVCSVHSQCMDHCLDDDQTEYEFWSNQREQLIPVCDQAAIHSREWSAHVNRFNTHNMPVRVRIMRESEMRRQAAL